MRIVGHAGQIALRGEQTERRLTMVYGRRRPLYLACAFPGRRFMSNDREGRQIMTLRSHTRSQG